MHLSTEPRTCTLKYVRSVLVLLLSFLAFAGSAQIPGEFYYNGEKPISLQGEWKFAPDTFLSYDGVLKDSLAFNVGVPGDWNIRKQDSSFFGPRGYGTYFVKILFDSNADISNLAIRIPEVSLAYSVYVDDQLVETVGKPGKNSEEEVARIDDLVIELPPIQGSSIYLILHISNFSYSYGGLFYPPKFGNEDDIRLEKERYNTIKLLILGTVIILAIYMLYVYLRLKKETFRVYFAIICLVLFFHTLATGDMPLLDIFPLLSWSIVKKFAFISFFLIASSNGKFLLELYPNYLRSKLINIYAIISLIAVLFALIVPVSISAYLIIPFQLTSVLMGIYFFESLIRATYARENGARFLLVGYAFAFFTGVVDILSAQYVIPAPRVAHYGMFAYILTMTVVMAMKYVDALRKNESIAESLSLSNELLERNIEDRTKKLKVQNEVIDAKNKELENALKEKDDLMAIVAHDLKAPFSQIEELSRLLKDEGKSTKNQATYLEMIQKITQNARNVIENLVFIRSYQSDTFSPEIRSFDPKAFFEAKMAAYLPEAKKKNIAIEHGHSIKGKKISSDESALDRIVDNLLSNAIKFSPEGSKIVMEMLEDDDVYVFRVKDYGEGFSAEDKKLAFQKFQKLSTKPTGGELSTGLGLSIVKTLVEKLNGEINLVSEKGKGAEFVVKIPKKPTLVEESN